MNELGQGMGSFEITLYGPNEAATEIGIDQRVFSFHIRGPLGQYHVRFPEEFRWMWEYPVMEIVACGMEVTNGKVRFFALYNSGDGFYLVKRTGENRTVGEEVESRDEFDEQIEQVLWERGGS